MAEISREECMSRLDCMRKSMSVCLATHNGFNDNFQIMKSMCDKSISDLEKLEKIERLSEDYANREIDDDLFIMKVIAVLEGKPIVKGE